MIDNILIIDSRRLLNNPYKLKPSLIIMLDVLVYTHYTKENTFTIIKNRFDNTDWWKTNKEYKIEHLSEFIEDVRNRHLYGF